MTSLQPKEQNQGINLSKVIESAPHPAATGRVIKAQAMMFPKTFQFTARLDLNQPTATTLPTMQCVVLTGTPMLEHSKTVVAVPSPMQKPLWKNKAVQS